MPKVADIKENLARLTPYKGRSKFSTEEDLAGVFATLAELGTGGGVFLGTFQGESAWERHGRGDELVQILDGATRLTIQDGDGFTVLELAAGQLTVVPKGAWHRFQSADGVTVLTMTPQPTDISTADDPR